MAKPRKSVKYTVKFEIEDIQEIDPKSYALEDSVAIAYLVTMNSTVPRKYQADVSNMVIRYLRWDKKLTGTEYKWPEFLTILEFGSLETALPANCILIYAKENKNPKPRRYKRRIWQLGGGSSVRYVR